MTTTTLDLDDKNNFKRYLRTVIEKDASDLHVTEGNPPTLRINGELVPIEGEPILTSEEAKNFAFNLLTPEQEERFLREKEIDISYTLQNRARFRVNVYYQKGYISSALRLIPTKIRTIEELYLPKTLHNFTKLQQGLFLVVGPSGHGKSTALAAMIDEINHIRTDHIITIEDPIEYIFEQDKCIIEQRELHRDTNSFERALRSALRQDPDVIMVGEMRDSETIAAALTAAETGHLVFATLHTNDASQTIDRIVDSFPPYQQSQIRYQLASTLVGVLSRRLLPKKQGGRINAVELLVANSAVRNLVRENKIYQIGTVIETGSDEGMISLNRSLTDLVKRGEVSLEVAESYSLNPGELRMILHS